MQPTPTKTDVPICDSDRQPCYLWIHLPVSPGRVITFPSIKQAYTFAEKYVYEENARPLLPGDEVKKEFDTTWSNADGVMWVSPGMFWNMTLAQIYNDISAGNIPDYNQWMTLGTVEHQMIIGLGSDLPEDCYTRFCVPNGYTLEDHDKPEDMPPLLRLVAAEEELYDYEFDYENGRWIRS